MKVRRAPFSAAEKWRAGTLMFRDAPPPLTVRLMPGLVTHGRLGGFGKNTVKITLYRTSETFCIQSWNRNEPLSQSQRISHWKRRLSEKRPALAKITAVGGDDYSLNRRLRLAGDERKTHLERVHLSADGPRAFRKNQEIGSLPEPLFTLSDQAQPGLVMDVASQIGRPTQDDIARQAALHQADDLRQLRNNKDCVQQARMVGDEDHAATIPQHRQFTGVKFQETATAQITHEKNKQTVNQSLAGAVRANSAQHGGWSEAGRTGNRTNNSKDQIRPKKSCRLQYTLEPGDSYWAVDQW